MKIIQTIAKPLDGLLWKQRREEGVPYRLIHFVVSQPAGDGLLLFNNMTKELLFLNAEETKAMESDPASVPGLIEDWFAVPQDHDDRKLAMEIRDVCKMLKDPVRGFKSFTILSTSDCNARCFYCYEKGRSRIHMSDETASETASYIIRNVPQGKASLHWFGGEPLYNKKAISRICSLLEEAGVEFKSTIISNGYLFDEETVEEAVKSWRLKKIQITLDGTETVYNRIKAFIYPGVNAFKRVIRNIHLLIDAGVTVSIRLNIDRHNSEDIFVLAEQLGKEFGGKPNVSVYSHSLFEACVPGAAVLHDETQRKELFEKQQDLRARLQELGLARVKGLRHFIKVNRCMADNDECAVILPDGHVGKCEHYSESEWFSHVSGMDVDGKILEDFKQLRPEMEACEDCPLYPDCFRLAKCEESVHCYPEEREEQLAEIRQQMLSFFNKHEVSH